jgi:peroxiredoxin (alkyl hydroperoxide reductase subunit C)
METSQHHNSVLVGHKAPDFTAAAVAANGELINEYHFAKETAGKITIVFFYPLDFTFVCPSELIALNKRMDEFKKRKVEVIGISIDSQFTHHAWRNTPVEKGGIGHVKYPLIADINHKICKAYGVEHPVAGVALRGTFLIDKHGVVRSQIVNDLPLGRNIDELIRLVDALEFYEENGEVCPAGWKKGDKGIKPSTEGIANYLSENAENL